MKFGIVLGVMLFMGAYEVRSAVCNLKRTSNGYTYIEQNGNAVSGSYYRQRDAVAQYRQLVENGICQSPSSGQNICQMRITSNGYSYVIQNGNPISASYYRQSDAIANFRSLRESGVCGQFQNINGNSQVQTIAPSPYACKMRITNNGYSYIVQNGTRVSPSYYRRRDAVAQFESLKEAGICQAPQHVSNSCSLRVTSNGYSYIVQNGNRVTGGIYRRSDAISEFQNLRQKGLCPTITSQTGNGQGQIRSQFTCNLRQTNNGYTYIVQNNQRVSGNIYRMRDAISVFTAFKDAGICLTSSGRNAVCNLRMTSNGYTYLVQNGHRVSGNIYRSRDALDLLDELREKNICDNRRVESCQLRRNSNGYTYIVQGDQPISINFYRRRDAVSFLETLYNKQACNENLQLGCQLRRTSNGYTYIQQDGRNISGNIYRQSDAISLLQSFNQKKVCLTAECDIKRSPNRYNRRFYVRRNNHTLARFDSLQEAITEIGSLRNVNTCSLNQAPSACPIRRRNQRFVMFKDNRRFIARQSLPELRQLRRQLINEGVCLGFPQGSNFNGDQLGYGGNVYDGNQGNDGFDDFDLPPSNGNQPQ